MEQKYLKPEHLSSMKDETLLDLVAQYRTMLEELEQESSRETEKGKLELERAMETVEEEIARRRLSAQG